MQTRTNGTMLALVTTLALATSVATADVGLLPDPSSDGPYDAGYVIHRFTRHATLVDAERAMDTYIWYPADAADEPRDTLGYAGAAVHAGRHPVLVFSHGGCAHPIASSYLTKALASWGFVVVTPSHPGDTIIDGMESCDWAELRSATLIERVADVRAVLDILEDDRWQDPSAAASPLARHLDLTRTGVLGWSSGASTALVVGREDPRIRGVLSLAPDVRPERIGLRPPAAPTMVMEGVLDFYDQPQTALDEIYRRLTTPRFAVEMQHTGHFAFSDDCFADLIGGIDCGDGTLSQDEAHRLVLRFAVPFLLRYVGGFPAWSPLLRPGRVMADAELRADLGHVRRLPPRK